MKDNLWKSLLRRQASAHGMCAEYRDALGSVETKHDAIALYKRCIDWALEEGYPSIDILRQFFSCCEDSGVFVDKHFDGEILDDQQVYVFHNCTGTVRVGLNSKKRIIPMLYFANGCNMNVRGIPGSAMQVRVPLYVFGQNWISAEQSDDVICKTYKFDVK